MIYRKVHIQPLPDNKYKVVQNFFYKEVMVPFGYETNGANIPRIFWSFIPPNKSDLMPAVILHDYLCDKGEYKKADDYFEEVLHELNVDKFTIFVLVKSVRIYHFFIRIFR